MPLAFISHSKHSSQPVWKEQPSPALSGGPGSEKVSQSFPMTLGCD